MGMRMMAWKCSQVDTLGNRTQAHHTEVMYASHCIEP